MIPPLSTAVNPWMLIELLFYLIAFIVFGKMTIIVLGVARDVANAVYEAATGPLQVIRDDPPADGRDDADDEQGNHHQRHEIRVVDGGARDPQPNRLWPPDDAFEEDNRRGDR